jgi:hypothetical protein
MATIAIDRLIFRPYIMAIPMQPRNEKTRRHLIHAADTEKIVTNLTLNNLMKKKYVISTPL